MYKADSQAWDRRVVVGNHRVTERQPKNELLYEWTERHTTPVARAEPNNQAEPDDQDEGETPEEVCAHRLKHIRVTEQQTVDAIFVTLAIKIGSHRTLLSVPANLGLRQAEIRDAVGHSGGVALPHLSCAAQTRDMCIKLKCRGIAFSLARSKLLFEHRR